MDNKTPPELSFITESILRAIARQPDQTMPIADALRMDFPGCKARLRDLIDAAYLRRCNLVDLFPSCYTVTHSGMDYLNRQASLAERLRKVEENLRRAESKAEEYQKKYEELQASHKSSSIAWAAIAGVMGSGLGALLGKLL